LGRARQPQHAEIIAGAGAGHAALLGEDPPGQPAAIGAQGPARAAAKIEKGDARLLGTGERRRRADRLDIGHGVAIAGEQQMIAIVDAAAELLVEIGAAAAARLRARFIERHG